VLSKAWHRLIFALLPATLIGCGPAYNRVSGRVLLDGKPLPGGRVTFRPADSAQNSASAEINEQGQYEVTLPIGDVQISIDNRELQPRAARGPIELPALGPDIQGKINSEMARSAPTGNKGSGRYVPVPSRYYDAETSGLSFTVKKGDQRHDIDLAK